MALEKARKAQEEERRGRVTEERGREEVERQRRVLTAERGVIVQLSLIERSLSQAIQEVIYGADPKAILIRERDKVRATMRNLGFTGYF